MSRSGLAVSAAFLTAGVMVLAGCGSGSGPAAPASFDEALAQAGRNDSLVLVDFYTDW